MGGWRRLWGWRRRLYKAHRACRLEDPRPLYLEAPYTFEKPSAEKLAAIAPGDIVKAIFLPTMKGTEEATERMWVAITGVNGNSLEGLLDNDPLEIPGLLAGDPIKLKRWHVINVDFQDPAQNRRYAGRERAYWDRCLVDDCVLYEDRKVHYVYREKPNMGSEDDEYPDSGWRIRGDWRGLSDEEIDQRPASYVALGAVLNQDDSWLHLIDEPAGSAFIRDWRDGKFDLPDPE